jgi:hypothetical protein
VHRHSTPDVEYERRQRHRLILMRDLSALREKHLEQFHLAVEDECHATDRRLDSSKPAGPHL